MSRSKFFIVFLASSLLVGLLLACTSGNTLRLRRTAPTSTEEKTEKETTTEKEEETEDEPTQETRDEPKPEPTWHEVFNMNGNGMKNTETFEIRGDEWKIEWSFDGGTGGFFQILVMKEGSDVPEHVPAITNETGSDTAFIRKSGKFYLKINSANGTWNLKVEDKY